MIPRLWRLARPRPRRRLDQERPIDQGRVRLRAIARRRPHTTRLQRDPALREGCHLRGVPPAGDHLLRRPRHHPDQATDRQRQGPPVVTAWGLRPARDTAEAHQAPLPVAERQGLWTVQPHPAGRVGLPPGLHQ